MTSNVVPLRPAGGSRRKPVCSVTLYDDGSSDAWMSGPKTADDIALMGMKIIVATGKLEGK